MSEDFDFHEIVEDDIVFDEELNKLVGQIEKQEGKEHIDKKVLDNVDFENILELNDILHNEKNKHPELSNEFDRLTNALDHAISDRLSNLFSNSSESDLEPLVEALGGGFTLKDKLSNSQQLYNMLNKGEIDFKGNSTLIVNNKELTFSVSKNRLEWSTKEISGNSKESDEPDDSIRDKVRGIANNAWEQIKEVGTNISFSLTGSERTSSLNGVKIDRDKYGLNDAFGNNTNK